MKQLHAALHTSRQKHINGTNMRRAFAHQGCFLHTNTQGSDAIHPLPANVWKESSRKGMVHEDWSCVLRDSCWFYGLKVYVQRVPGNSFHEYQTEQKQINNSAIHSYALTYLTLLTNSMQVSKDLSGVLQPSLYIWLALRDPYGQLLLIEFHWQTPDRCSPCTGEWWGLRLMISDSIPIRSVPVESWTRRHLNTSMHSSSRMEVHMSIQPILHLPEQGVILVCHCEQVHKVYKVSCS